MYAGSLTLALSTISESGVIIAILTFSYSLWTYSAKALYSGSNFLQCPHHGA